MQTTTDNKATFSLPPELLGEVFTWTYCFVLEDGFDPVAISSEDLCVLRAAGHGSGIAPSEAGAQTYVPAHPAHEEQVAHPT